MDFQQIIDEIKTKEFYVNENSEFNQHFNKINGFNITKDNLESFIYIFLNTENPLTPYIKNEFKSIGLTLNTDEHKLFTYYNRIENLLAFSYTDIKFKRREFYNQFQILTQILPENKKEILNFCNLKILEGICKKDYGREVKSIYDMCLSNFVIPKIKYCNHNQYIKFGYNIAGNNYEIFFNTDFQYQHYTKTTPYEIEIFNHNDYDRLNQILKSYEVEPLLTLYVALSNPNIEQAIIFNEVVRIMKAL